MDKTKTRIIIFLVTLIILFGVTFGVWVTEEKKRLDQYAADNAAQAEAIAKLQAQGDILSSIAQERALMEEQMAQVKANYEAILSKQPEIVASQKTTETQTVQKTVPVQYTTQVPSSSSSSKSAPAAKTTKTS